MSLPRDWVEMLVWTGHDKGYGRSSGWELWYLPRLYPPCVVYRVAGWSFVLSGDTNNSARRCVCIRGTPLGLDCLVDFLPGGIWIGYIRPSLEDGSLIDAAPVTGSLVSSTLFSCQDVYCTAGFSSDWTFLCLACWIFF